MPSTYVTVAIPYVNARPHLGYAFELVVADVFARAARARGERVRFLGGTDDHSLKNVLAAEAAGVPTAAFVADHAQRFAGLAEPLDVSFDDFIRTSTDPRHRPAVERLWQACATAGDLYPAGYEGRYCVGCEEFLAAGELVDGRCVDHGTEPELVVERNWFFRLSRYTDALVDLVRSGRLAITPSVFRDEVLALLRRGLTDISVSRSVDRARGWGIAVPGDDGQVVYVWFDALVNYISALGYGDPTSPRYGQWWTGADRRVHVVGKGILRFHAVYWPAFLLSAGEPLPTEIHVHPYLTVDGAKLSKSAGPTLDPIDLVKEVGTDRVRWWLTRGTAATADTDYTLERLVARADQDLANGIGNAVQRVVTLVHRFRAGVVPATAAEPVDEASALPDVVAGLLATFDRRAATTAILDAVDALNRDLDATRPWALRSPDDAERLDAVLDRHQRTLELIARALAPIVPALSRVLVDQLTPGPDGRLPAPRRSIDRLADQHGARRRA